MAVGSEMQGQQGMFSVQLMLVLASTASLSPLDLSALSPGDDLRLKLAIRLRGQV